VRCAPTHHGTGYPGGPDHPFLGDGSGSLYRRKHAPLLSFPSITDSRQRREHIVRVDPSRPDNAFAADVRSGNLPEYAFYSPNMKNDGHDTSLDFAARWLQRFLDSTKFPEGTLVVVTFDESAGSRDNRIYTVFLGDMVAPGTRVAQPYNHYSVLRTIEDNFGLPPLAGGDGSARAITGAWSPEVVARVAASQDAPGLIGGGAGGAGNQQAARSQLRPQVGGSRPPYRSAAAFLPRGFILP
jgi:phosphoesterase family protein